ncbi:MAG: hypothetical protein ACE5GT_01795 [Rhodospirillales bacterium]
MNRIAGAAFALALLVAGVEGSPAVAGHGISHYPSYYPDEIHIDTMDPAAAALGLERKTLHAYVGGTPAFDGRVPAHVKSLRSLGSFLVLSFDPASKAFASAERRCAAQRGIRARLREQVPGAIYHPYPVTPYHADYLHHLDRIMAAKTAGDAEPLVSADRDVRLEAVPVADLIAGAGMPLDGRPGPPWVKEGWFQAYTLLAPAVTNPETRRSIDALYGRLMTGDYAGLAERANLQRQLIAALTAGCERPVVGYTLNHEYINDDFTLGIENIAIDSQRGLNAAVFVRTAKLKDYPWNGTLRLGLDRRPKAAWNPVAGFTDAAGRLIWSAVGDPALVPFPFNASWIPNRLDFTVTGSRGQSGGIRVPADALSPEPGTGALRPVGERAFASAKVDYGIVASPFQDGTETGFADLLYPFVLAYRWGAKAVPGDPAHEPRLEATLADIRNRLVGVRPVRVDEAVKIIAPGLDVIQKTPLLEVYLRDAPGDRHQVAALAPPWSTVPWHLLALMEEAVRRGYAAFSEEEAKRRKVPWLDLARDRPLFAKLMDLTRELEAKRYRPEALKDLVTREDAGRRWRALRTFAEKTGHFLVTNGPYRLQEWSSSSAVLKAVRDVTYPLGFGSFDRYVHPPRAVIREVTQEAGSIVVRADAEQIIKVERHYENQREPLTRQTTHGLFGVLVVSRYLLIGPDGTVVAADKMRWRKDGRFVADLPKRMAPGGYTALVAVFLDGNSLTPSTKVLRFWAQTQ